MFPETSGGRGRACGGLGGWEPHRQLAGGVHVVVARQIVEAFAERGASGAKLGDELYQLTWTSGRAFVLRLADFSLVREHRYAGKGWGLAYDGARLVMSDGSATLRFRDPTTFRVERELEVREGVRAIEALNELEVVNGSVFANVWRSDRVARIDPASGAVTGWLDLSSIAARERSAGSAGVANGIAWDGRRLFVTGKLWRSVYGLELLR